MDWFPDRKGLAGGLVIAGFGSGLNPYWTQNDSYLTLINRSPILHSDDEHAHIQVHGVAKVIAAFPS